MHINTLSDFRTIISDKSEIKSEIIASIMVKAKIHGGGVVERRVWEMEGDMVYLCTDRVLA